MPKPGPAVAESRPCQEVQEAAGKAASLRDWWVLLKPNVMQLVVFTAAVGLFLAPGSLHPLLAGVAILCIAAGAAASAALNNAWDADIDCLMARTRLRPTACGRIEPAEAATLGVTLALLAVMVLGLASNWLAAGLLAFTIFFYVVVYTMWLKRRTPHNIVIGGAAGALPPAIGWVAVTGSLDLLPVLLFALIFLWTPAHFWALALFRQQDYSRVGVPMLPIRVGEAVTRRQILLYAAATVAISLVILPVGSFGLLYASLAVLAGSVWFGQAWRLFVQPGQQAALRLFRGSILYLFVIFLAMVADRAVGSALS